MALPPPSEGNLPTNVLNTRRATPRCHTSSCPPSSRILGPTSLCVFCPSSLSVFCPHSKVLPLLCHLWIGCMLSHSLPPSPFSCRLPLRKCIFVLGLYRVGGYRCIYTQDRVNPLTHHKSYNVSVQVFTRSVCQINPTTGSKEFKKLSKLSKVKYERQMLICKIWLGLLCEWGLVASWCEFCVHGSSKI